MILSIIILCCDKDYQMVSSLLDNIYNVWQEQHDSFLDYQVVIVDNRENEADKDVDWHLYKGNLSIYKSGGNIRQFTSRAISTQIAKGDYIWFVDADDNILEIPRIPNKQPDILFYKVPTMYDGYGTCVSAYNNIVMEEHINIDNSNRQQMADLLLSDAAIVLWNRIISRGLLIDCYKNIDLNELRDISVNEDMLLSIMLMDKCSSIGFIKQVCYKYNMSTSGMGTQQIDNTAFDRIVHNYPKTIHYMYTLYNCHALSINISKIIRVSISCMLYSICMRLPVCKDKQYVINWLLRHWRRDTVFEILNNLHVACCSNQEIIDCSIAVMNTEDNNKTHDLEEIYETLNTNTVL